MTILLLILGLLLFIGLVVVHEWGHFIMARRNGVDVEEFGIGFPPRAKLLTKKNGTEYTLNWLPLGGFVKLKGEHDADTEPGTFGAASLAAKTKIMIAGVVMNLITAFVLLTLLALAGMPQLINRANSGQDQFTVVSDERVVRQDLLVNYIEKDSPAQKSGLKQLDSVRRIESTNGTQRTIRSLSDLQAATKEFAGQSVKLNYERDGKPAVATVELRSAQDVEASKKTDQPKGYLGVALSDYQVKRYTWSAPVVAAGFTAQLTELTLKGLGKAVQGLGGMIAAIFTGNQDARTQNQRQATEQVSGPLGIFFVLKAGAQEGIGMVLLIIAVISLTLAIMNVLPIPALDGGRLFLTLLYRAMRRPLTQRAEELINSVGFITLMVLFALITLVDVRRFF